MPQLPQRIHRILCIPEFAEIAAAGCVSILDRAADDELEDCDESVFALCRHVLAEYDTSDLGAMLVCTDVSKAAGHYCANEEEEEEEEEGDGEVEE